MKPLFYNLLKNDLYQKKSILHLVFIMVLNYLKSYEWLMYVDV